MKPNLWLMIFAAAALAGCATPFRAPPDVAHIKLERADSPVVVVEKIWLERKSGPLLVKGYVTRQIEGADTTGTHLDVTLIDQSGRELRSIVAHFDPRQIVHRLRHPDYAAYQALLDPLPKDTVRILVQAHEGGH